MIAAGPLASLRAEGIDPRRIGDRALWLDPEAGAFRPLDAAGHDACSGLVDSEVGVS